MALVQVTDLTMSFRGPPLLDSVNCQIEPGQRIGLLGRNGSGKTTLMRILAGDVEPDSGTVAFTNAARVSLLPQDVPKQLQGSIEDVVWQGIAPRTPEAAADWQVEQQVGRLLSRMDLDPHAQVETLSSGMKRRVLLAQALVAEPDLLLLDEPTNHLDIDAITWLEEFLANWPTTLLFVTHDRAFLRRIATRILEIDRGQLFDWSCSYDTFLQRKEAALAAEEKQDALFDKKLAEEEAWIRQGIKARRTRNEGRVRALQKMRDERRARREKVGAAKLDIHSIRRSGTLVVKAEGISFAYSDKPIVRNFSTTLVRGDKVGLIGPNGAGKSTLLRLLLGNLKPLDGHVRLGTNLEVAYFDQLRQELDHEATAVDNVGEGSDHVMIRGRPRHVLGYLQSFLFTPERARTEVKFFSGGEQNRLLLAKLFAKPANVIVMDEPTNDLDTETLELLEARLVEFDGTLLVVSHDREFLNDVVTSTIVFEPDGVREYDGGYDDWVRQRADQPYDRETPKSTVRKSAVANASEPLRQRARKLAYHEKRELESLPELIERMDREIAELTAAMSNPDFYKQATGPIADSQARMQQLSKKLATAYKRWEELEARQD